MRRLATLLALASLLVSGPASAAEPAHAPDPGVPAAEVARAERAAEGIPWVAGSFSEALARAEETGQPLLVDVYATWCGPCQALEREVFPQPEVAEAARGYVAVRVDGEAGEGPKVVERYHVVGFPTLLFLTPDGREIDRLFGPVDAPALVEALEGFRDGTGTLEALTRRAESRPLDLDLAAEVGFRQAIRGNAVEAKRHYARLFAARRLLMAGASAPSRGAADVSRLGPAGDFLEVRPKVEADLAGSLEHVEALIAGAYLTLGKYLYLRGRRDYDSAISILEELRKRFPDSPEAAEAPFQLAVALFRDGRPRRARLELRRYLAANDRSVEAAGAVAWFCHHEGAFPELGIEVARQALDRAPDTPGLWDTLAELLADEGDLDAALAAAAEAAERRPNDAYFTAQRRRFAALVAARDAAAEARRRAEAEADEAGSALRPAAEDGAAPPATPASLEQPAPSAAPASAEGPTEAAAPAPRSAGRTG